MIRHWKLLGDPLTRILLHGKESPKRRLKALLHTFLGVCYAVMLRGRGVDHIHAHHGYFGSWIAMVAARLLRIGFSLTLHGSDLLVNGAYLDTKLKNCKFCVTISEYNRRYILEHYPDADAGKVIVSRLGVNLSDRSELPRSVVRDERRTITLLTVGRLHAVKDQVFLVRACARLRDRGLDFKCLIAGEGMERGKIELLIREHRLQNRVTLLGHIDPPAMDSLYRHADLLVLTSRSEGIPLVLMEAMARGRIVIAPAITGIPELVVAGRTGFLYTPGAMEDLVVKITFVQRLIASEARNDAVSRLDWIRHAARVQILHHFSRTRNLIHFGDLFLQRIAPEYRPPRTSQPHNSPTHHSPTQDWSPPHEDSVLQQV
jgi:colanic acid/amylovoran biosynthesis glycosyltransferase